MLDIENTVCPFCDSSRAIATYKRVYHPFVEKHGPFDLYTCQQCRSLFTWPLPSETQLNYLYSNYEQGLPGFQRELIKDPNAWHWGAVKRMTKLSGFTKNSCFRWLDLGAGAGEMAILMNKMFPNSQGYCIDFHNCPNELLSLSASVVWHSLDINSDWASHIKSKFEIVYATAVLEHVLKPAQVMKQIGSVIEKNALVYFINPLYGTFAQRILKKRWPYFTPGEHLNIPTINGMMQCMQRGFAMDSNQGASVRQILMNYPLKYVFARFGMKRIAEWVPESLIIPLPAGAGEAAVRFS